MADIKEIISDSFCQYAGAVIQSRALVDARDGLKPSARQIFYSMLQNKLIHKNKFKKTMNAVGRAMADYYIHGDTSAEGIVMRAGQGFSMRYPLIDINGNAGTLISTESWAAPRYTESRLSEISDYLFADIEKNVIDEWRDNYDNTKVYPAVLPSKGFYNLCNGTMGIAVGIASSIPQYNLKELNNALITLLNNPNASFEEIYCAPDFATGAVLYNESEVKESMKNGHGAACKLRSVIEYDEKDNCLVVTEIPYSVYTNTICKQLDDILESEDNPGIDRYIDLTGENPLIKIYLIKNVKPDKIINYLYKNTSLQKPYGINFTMLDMGKKPKLFTWKETLQAHIDHEKVVYKRELEFDLNKIINKIHIINGILICLAYIEEVIEVIKTSSSAAAASQELQKRFVLDEVQAKAVLDMKLARLAHLEVEKLKQEKTDLEKEQARIEDILNDVKKFNQLLIDGWNEVANKYGDARRTKVLDLIKGGEEEPVEIKQLYVSLTNKNNIIASEASTLYTKKRNTAGSKIKMSKDEYVINSITLNNNESILFFTKEGNVFKHAAASVELNKLLDISTLINSNESVCVISNIKKDIKDEYVFFITQNGLIKKTAIEDFNIKKTSGTKAITLKDDCLVNVFISKDGNIGLLSSDGNFLMFDTSSLNATGRVAKGISGMKLNKDQKVVAGHILPQTTKFICSITSEGYIKKTSFTEYASQLRANKGSHTHKLQDTDKMADFIPLEDESEIIISTNDSYTKLATSDIPELGKATLGIKSIKLNSKNFVNKMAK